VYWFFTALIAAIVVTIALIAAGRGDAMAQAWPDRRYLSLPEGRALTAADLDSLRLAVAFRGYRMEEVDDLLDRLGVEIAARDAQIERLQDELAAERNDGRLDSEGSVPGPAEAAPPRAESSGDRGSWLPLHRGDQQTPSGPQETREVGPDQARTRR
jgi:DivIVA domain-containing protein